MKKAEGKAGALQRISGHDFHSWCSVRDPWEEERDTDCRTSARTLEENSPQPWCLQAFSSSVLTYSTFSFLHIAVLFLQAPGQGLWLCTDKWNFLKVISSAKKRGVWNWKSTNRVCIYRTLICLLQRGSAWLIFGFLQMFHHPPGLKVGTLEWQELKRFYLKKPNEPKQHANLVSFYYKSKNQAKNALMYTVLSDLL